MVPLLLLILLSGLFTSAASPPATPEPFPHIDFNSLFPPSGGFYQGAKLGYVKLQSTEYESNTTSTIKPDNPSTSTSMLENPSATMNGTLSSISPTLYVHNGSAAYIISAIGRAVSDGVDVIRLDVFCPKIREDLHLDAAVWKARKMGGKVVVCQGDPTPQFVQVVAGGPPITKSIPFSIAGGHRGGAAFVSEVQIFCSDLNLLVSPRVVSFESPGQENKNVTITVIAHTGGGSGKRWCEAHVHWQPTSRGGGDRVTVFILSILQSG